MQTQLIMNHNSITNLKDPEFGGEAATKSYADKKLDLAGGTMTGELDMGTKQIRNLGYPIASTDAVSANFVQNLLTNNYLHYGGGTMSGQIDMNKNKIINLPEPTEDNDAATKDFVEKSHVSQSGLQQNVFLYQMTDVNESSSESNITVTGIKDFANTPHTLFKKAYHFTIGKMHKTSTTQELGLTLTQFPQERILTLWSIFHHL